ncbi:MAG: hypothetical protein ACYDGM_02800 [Vulcanimicrobiaceae bacterium]
MHRSIATWVIGFFLATFLSVAGPAIYFNRATPLILGMPPLFFWFLLVPILTVLILWGVYAVDRASGGIGNDVEEQK